MKVKFWPKFDDGYPACIQFATKRWSVCVNFGPRNYHPADYKLRRFGPIEIEWWRLDA